MRRVSGTASVVVVLVAACTTAYGTDPGDIPPPARDDAGGDGSVDGGPNPGQPKQAPAGITFKDEDPRERFVKGTVTISKAADEDDIVSYRLYWGTPATTKLTEIGTVPKTGANVTIALEAPMPTGATHLLAYSVNAAAEMNTGVALGAIDNFTTFVDLSGTRGPGVATQPVAVIDTANKKLLVAIRNAANNGKAGLVRCNVDGSACDAFDVSSGQGTDSGINPSIAIDPKNGKILIAAENGANGYRPALYRCNLDGTGCAYVDISAGEGVGSGYRPSLVVDAVNDKILVAVRNGGLAYAPGVFRCNLDGTSCVFRDISAGAGDNSGTTPQASIDTKNGKLLVVTDNGANEKKSSLFRCNLDATGCTHTDISAGQSQNSGLQPSVQLDATNDRLYVVTQGGGLGSFVRCDSAGTGCVFTNLSTVLNVVSNPSMRIDTTNKKLLVSATNIANGNKLALVRCELDGTKCATADISAGQGVNSGVRSTALVDTAGASPRLLVVTEHGTGHAGLYSLALW